MKKIGAQGIILFCLIGFVIPCNIYSAPKDKTGMQKVDMSKTEVVLQLAITVSQLIAMISGLVVKSLAQANPRQFDPKVMEKIGEFVLGFDQLLIKIRDLQAEQVLRKQNGEVVMITVGNRMIPATKMSLRNQCRKGTQKGAVCTALSCEKNDACTRAIMRDLIGYSYRNKAGEVVKKKGIITEMLKVIFIGYKDKEGKRHQSMFELLADISKMPEDTKKEIIQSVRTSKRILKLVSQLTFVEPEGDAAAIIAKQQKQKNKKEQLVKHREETEAEAEAEA